MEAIILAAGYATRLYPLTKDTPKPLLKVANVPIIAHILAKIRKINDIKKIYIVTNSKFHAHFSKWLGDFIFDRPIEIIDDGTTSNDNRLGAMGDINFVLKQKKIDDDLLVVAGDNLFDFELDEVESFFRKKESSVIVAYDVKNPELAKQYGIIEQSNCMISNFVEKPAEPKSTLASTGIYLFTRKNVELIEEYISQGNNPDKTGSFIEWLYKREKVLAFVTEKTWYDIGTKEQLAEADKKYRAK